eukprot:scaffold230105_cov30-Tisochrysis_lutea.AAC.1
MRRAPDGQCIKVLLDRLHIPKPSPKLESSSSCGPRAVCDDFSEEDGTLALPFKSDHGPTQAVLRVDFCRELQQARTSRAAATRNSPPTPCLLKHARSPSPYCYCAHRSVARAFSCEVMPPPKGPRDAKSSQSTTGGGSERIALPKRVGASAPEAHSSFESRLAPTCIKDRSAMN